MAGDLRQQPDLRNASQRAVTLALQVLVVNLFWPVASPTLKFGATLWLRTLASNHLHDQGSHGMRNLI